MRSLKSLCIWGAAFAVSACFYDPDLSKISKDEDEDTATTETGTEDAGIDDAGENGDEFSGIGTTCEAKSDDCAEFDADYCLVDPTNPEAPGLCTITDCDTRGCPDAYQCCDCSELGMEIMCVPDASAAAVGPYCQCS